MDFSELEPREVLHEEAIPEYERGMDFFYLGQLVPLNANIYIIEQVLEFPFELFVSPEDTIFFRLLVDNFYNTGLLTITRLATDSGKDLYTLLQFKNWVAQQVKDEFKEDFQKHLKQAKFDKKTQEMLEKARGLRNTSVAHIKRDLVLGNIEQDRLNFVELKALRDALNVLLKALSFNKERLMLPIQYHLGVVHPAGADSRSDIQRILDNIARDSNMLNLPEKNPHHWAAFRKNLSEENLRTINKYRAKFGLPEVG